MTVYLKYRLERSGVSQVKNVCIFKRKRTWMFQDISAEFNKILPGANVWSSDNPMNPTCDLAVIPFMLHTDTSKFKYSALRYLRRFKPRYIGFYELEKRRLVIVRRKFLPLFYLRKGLERIGRFGILLFKRIAG